MSLKPYASAWSDTDRSPFAIAGDWHMNGRYAAAAVHYIHDNADGAVETILHVGDFGWQYADEFIDELESALSATGTMCYAIRGNHDSTHFLHSLNLDDQGFGVISDHIRYMPSGVHTIDGTSVCGVGGAVSVNKYDLVPMIEWWDDEAITASEFRRVLNDIAENSRDKISLMISHDLPSSVPINMNLFSEHISPNLLAASAANRNSLDMLFQDAQPDFLVHGHMHHFHESYGGSTYVVGLNCDGTPFTRNVVLAAREDNGDVRGLYSL